MQAARHTVMISSARTNMIPTDLPLASRKLSHSRGRVPHWSATLTFAVALVMFAPRLAGGGEAPPPATLENTSEVVLSSSTNTQDYRIQIALPYSYADSERSYPVVYLLDANVQFGLLTDIARLLPLEGVPMFLGKERVPELIVVRIGYPGGIAEMSQKRGWDMNPPEGESGEINPNGGANFYLFFAQDLIPWVESNYRAEPTDRTLLGVSRGGVFVLTTLFLHPETFQRFIAISPTIEPPIYDYIEAYSKRKELPRARLFVSAGSAGDIEEGIATGLLRLTERLAALDDSRLAWSTASFDGESHVSVVPKALVEALMSVFSKSAAPPGTEK